MEFWVYYFALSWDSNIAIAGQEIIRRAKHFHPELSLEEQLQHMGDIEDLMLNSGYSWNQVREVMTSGLLGL